MLSVGEKQRVALAQVIIREPRLIILDEPTGTMDPITKVSVAKIGPERQEGAGGDVLVVSHDMDFVINCCDRAIFMKDGKIAAVGDPKSVTKAFGEQELNEMMGGSGAA